MSRRIHFIGIGGTGLSAIARVLLEQGEQVTGSDREYSPLAQAVEAAGARVYRGHSPDYVQGADVVIRSSAIPDEHPEVEAARQAGIPVLKRVDFLKQLLAGRDVIAIAGSHGKTTTTSMTAWVLSALGQKPGFVAGSVVENLGVNAAAGESALFVIEADEYDYMFLGLYPYLAVVTNVEHDHPDLFPTFEAFYAAFESFARQVRPDGALLVCADDAGSQALGAQMEGEGARVLRYAVEGQGAEYRAVEISPNVIGGFDFTALRPQGAPQRVRLSVPGRHNVANALAVLAVCDRLGLDWTAVAEALTAFRGSGRRFDVRGEAGGVVVVDDYAHHPTEIRATLQAARSRYPQRRIVAVWQPHTYTRTRALYADFLQAFADADVVAVTDVYRAREPFDPDFSVAALVEAMPHPAAHYTASLEETVDFLLGILRPGDVLLVLSAGDAPQVSAAVLEALPAVMEERG